MCRFGPEELIYIYIVRMIEMNLRFVERILSSRNVIADINTHYYCTRAIIRISLSISPEREMVHHEANQCHIGFLSTEISSGIFDNIIISNNK